MIGVILYGPPAAGKDTITRALGTLDDRYQLFPRLKAGPGRTTGYRMTTTAEIDRLRQAGEIVWENHRYDAVYATDRPELRQRLTRHVPVLHVGQVEAVDAIRDAVPDARWLIVQVWCPREVAEARIVDRATGDTEARLRAWDETTTLDGADLTIDTGQTDPDTAARTIHQAVEQQRTATG